jgi:hypothetical protein
MDCQALQGSWSVTHLLENFLFVKLFDTQSGRLVDPLHDTLRIC